MKTITQQEVEVLLEQGKMEELKQVLHESLEEAFVGNDVLPDPSLTLLEAEMAVQQELLTDEGDALEDALVTVDAINAVTKRVDEQDTLNKTRAALQ
jgi:hypothetical protein